MRMDAPGAFDWARCRWPLSERTPLPEVGQPGLWHPDKHTEGKPCTVLEVNMQPPTARQIAAGDVDWHVWRFRVDNPLQGPVVDDEGVRIVELVDDPWPDLLLKVDGMSSHVITREARLEGSAGWRPL